MTHLFHQSEQIVIATKEDMQSHFDVVATFVNKGTHLSTNERPWFIYIHLLKPEYSVHKIIWENVGELMKSSSLLSQFCDELIRNPQNKVTLKLTDLTLLSINIATLFFKTQKEIWWEVWVEIWNYDLRLPIIKWWRTLEAIFKADNQT